VKKEKEQLQSELKESLKENNRLTQTLSQIQNHLIQSTNESTDQLQSSNLSSISISFQESLVIKLDDINQYENEYNALEAKQSLDNREKKIFIFFQKISFIKRAYKFYFYI
jgi:soluble cytochrome b562